LSLIEELAEKRYAVTWNESSQDEPGFLRDPTLRSRYAQIECRRGVMYEHSPHEIAWRIGDGTAPTAKFLRRLIRNKPEWLGVYVDCRSETQPHRNGIAYGKELSAQGLEFVRPDEDEAVVVFHRSHFPEAAKLAGAVKRRGRKNLTPEEKTVAARNLRKSATKNFDRNDPATH